MSELMSIEDLEATLNSIQAEVPPNVPEQASKQASAPAKGSHLDLNEYVDAERLKSDVEFSLSDLDNAMRQHAGLYVHYANQARLARRQWERMKVTTEVLESRLYAIHREAMAAEGKKTTEAQVDATVKGDPRWFAAQQKLIDARAIYDLANDAREAFTQRKDMLVQVSVDRRTERQGELRIMAVEEKENAVQAARTQALNAVIASSRAA